MTRVILALLCATPVLAQDDPLAPYDRIRVDGSDVCIGWQQRDYTYTPDAAGSARTPEETEFEAIDASFRTWQAASEVCSDFQFVRGERKADTVFGFDRAPGATNDNIIVFREESCRDVAPAEDACWSEKTCANAYRCWNLGDYTIAITLTTFTSNNGTILDADIALNGGRTSEGTRFLFTAVDHPVCELTDHPGCVSTDIQNTLTHEIGHALGFDHVSTPGSTMELSAPIGETHKRILDHGTRTGLCEVYPAGLPFTDCRNPSAPLHVDATNAGTSLFGCAASPAAPAAWALLLLVRCCAGGRRARSAALRRDR